MRTAIANLRRLALAALLALLSAPSFAGPSAKITMKPKSAPAVRRVHASAGPAIPIGVMARGGGAGPNDTDQTFDYARAIGSPDDPTLSTGWTSGHGDRTQETHDYYRHIRSGRLIHVHGYYHRSER